MAVLIAMLACALAGAASASSPVWMTPDPSPRPATIGGPDYLGDSANGSTIFFYSSEPYTGVDPGLAGALFASRDGAIQMIAAGNAGWQVRYEGASADGTHVFFGEPQPFTSFSFGYDLEMSTAGVSTVIAGADASPGFICASPDGSRVVFEAAQPVAPGGLVGQEDLYTWSNGVTTLLTPQPPGAADEGNYPWGVSIDCSHIFFETSQEMVPGQIGVGGPGSGGVDGANVYDAGPNGIQLISTGPTGTGQGNGATFVAASADGSHVYFTTTAALVPEDRDTQSDLYEHFGATTQLVALPQGGGTAAHDAVYNGSSNDGSHTLFTTSQPLLPADTDTSSDVYDLTSHGLGLISTVTGVQPDLGAAFFGASADGTRVLYAAAGGLYEAAGGVSQPLPVSPPRSTAGIPQINALSSDGSELVFSTEAQLVPLDRNQLSDIYVTANGADALLVPDADTANTPARFVALTPDGRSAYIDTDAPLSPADTNGSSDIYKIAVPVPQPPVHPSPSPPAGTPSPSQATPPPTAPPTTGPGAPTPKQFARAVHRLAAALRAQITPHRLAQLLRGQTVHLRLDSSLAGTIVVTIALQRPNHTSSILVRVVRKLRSPRSLRIPLTIDAGNRHHLARGRKPKLELRLAVTARGGRTITAVVRLS